LLIAVERIIRVTTMAAAGFPASMSGFSTAEKWRRLLKDFAAGSAEHQAPPDVL